MPLISPENTLYLWVALFAVVAFGMWAEKRAWGKKLGATVIVLILGFILGNAGVLPNAAPLYGTVWGMLVPLAIPLLLFQADIRTIVKESGPTLAAFVIGAVGTIAGVMAAFALIALPAEAANLAGVFAATFIGGGMNFVATSQSLGLSDSALLLPAAAADNIVTILFLFVLAMAPSVAFFARRFPAARDGKTAPAAKTADTLKTVDYGQAVLALFIAFVLVAAGRGLEDALALQGSSILFTTAFTIVLATAAPKFCRGLGDAFGLGMVLMLIFFTTLGASASVAALVDTAPVLFLFAMIVVAVHFAVILVIGRIAKLTLPETLTGSNACILGPATAAGLAAAQGWKSLVTPGILVGTLGYAIGTFIGVGLAGFLG